MLIAARVAAQLRKDPSLEVKKVRGSFGELRVTVDGEDVPTGGVFGFATPASVVEKVRARLDAPRG